MNASLQYLGTKTVTEVTRTSSRFQENLPNIKRLTDSEIWLLGAPVSDASIKPAIEDKVQNLHLMNGRLTCLEPNQATSLLKSLFLMPKQGIY